MPRYLIFPKDYLILMQLANDLECLEFGLRSVDCRVNSLQNSIERNLMKVVELFAGIGGFRIACDELGLKTIWANDINSKASMVYRSQFGAGEFIEGDISGHLESIPEHDILTGGFPCQPFSSAGKKLGIEDVRGTLFETIVKILRNRQPDYFVLENVKRLLTMDAGSHFATILDALSTLGYLVEWRLLNAMNFGLPQNRERVVICGRRPGSFLTSKLCTEEDLMCIDAQSVSSLLKYDRWHSIEKHGKKFLNWGLAIDGKFFTYDISEFSEKRQEVKLKSVLEKSPDKKYFFTQDTLKRIELSDEVNRYFNGVEILFNQKGGARMGYTIFGENGLAPTLTCTASRHYERYKINNEYRRLTNIEYARIQGFPDDHCKVVSPHDQYPLYGNAVPPPLVKWAIAKTLSRNPVPLNVLEIQKELI